MTALDYILDGLEAELELERELGVRAIDIDRSLLAVPAASVAESGSPPPPPVPKPPSARPPGRPAEEKSQIRKSSGSPVRMCFLHHRSLGPKENDMMAKTVAALHETPSSAPVVTGGDMPKASVYVVMGAAALRKWFPGVKAAPGSAFTGEGGEHVVCTYAPVDVLRYSQVTPQIEKMKRSMWASIKAAARKIGEIDHA